MSTQIPIINMLKTDMSNIIDITLPEGYCFRNYKQGDREVWVELYNDLDDYIEITPELFDKNYGFDHELLSRSMFFMCYDGKEVGTITAWPEDDIDGEKTSRLHWLGVSREHRGRHLGAALVSHVLKHMQKNGCKKCVLGTSEQRIEALNMYFNFGFLPVVYTNKYSPIQDQKDSWLRVKDIISAKHRDKINP